MGNAQVIDITTARPAGQPPAGQLPPQVDAQVAGWFVDTRDWLVDNATHAHGIDEMTGVANACAGTLTGVSVGADIVRDHGCDGLEFDQWLTVELAEATIDTDDLTAMYGTAPAGRRAMADHCWVLGTYADLLASLRTMVNAQRPTPHAWAVRS